MNTITRSLRLACMLLLTCLLAHGQQPAHDSANLKPAVLLVLNDSARYPIKTIPGDTNADRHMPKYNPGKDGDSTYFEAAATYLRYLQSSGRIKYSIKTVPGDTTVDRNMPKVNPEGNDFVTVDVAPVVVKQVKAEYPASARRTGLSGAVYVNCLIGKDGSVKNAKVIQSAGPALDKAAVDAAKQWKFKPGTLKGKPVEVWTTLPFHFPPKD